MSLNYCVYLHTFPDGKKYVGITSKEPIRRWNHGRGYYTQPKMHEAINKYGWKNVSSTILIDKLSKEQAQSLEEKLIIQFNSVNNGYNEANGVSNTFNKFNGIGIEDYVKVYRSFGTTKEEIRNKLMFIDIVIYGKRIKDLKVRGYGHRSQNGYLDSKSISRIFRNILDNNGYQNNTIQDFRQFGIANNLELMVRGVNETK